MRRSESCLAWMCVLLSICASLAVPQMLVANPAYDDGGVAEFIRTHPGYHGYVCPRPPYPLLSQRNHEQGTVVVRVTFAKEGQVSAVKVIKPSGYQNLDRNAVNYIKTFWRSTYGRERTMNMPLAYRLE